METKEEIESVLGEKKALSFSMIKREIGRANGVLQYHIGESEKVEKKKDAIVEKGYCSSCKLRSMCESKCLIKQVRKPIKREILLYLHRGRSQKDIAEKIEKDASTVSYHIQRMEEEGIIEDGRPIEEVRELLHM